MKLILYKIWVQQVFYPAADKSLLILGINIISFDNSMHEMSKTCIWFGYNVEKQGWIEFSLGKKLIYNFTTAITRIYLAICEVQSNNFYPTPHI